MATVVWMLLAIILLGVLLTLGAGRC